MNATVSWNAVTTNADSTPITDLAGYVVYHGISSGNYIPADQVTVLSPTTTYIYTTLDVGITHYFNVKAVDTTGNLSTFGGEVTKSEPYPVYVQNMAMVGVVAPRGFRETDTSHMVSGFLAEALGLNVPVGAPPPDQFPIYEAIGGFMIV